MDEVQDVVASLVEAGVEVLSPADPRVVDAFGEFLFVASDRRRKIRTVQDRHLAAIAASDFLWLVAPAGYVGVSAAMEIGCAVEHHVPIFGSTPPNDLTLRQYVCVTQSVGDAIVHTLAGAAAATSPGLLVDPRGAAERVHEHIDWVQARLVTPSTEHGDDDKLLRSHVRDLRGALRGL